MMETLPAGAMKAIAAPRSLPGDDSGCLLDLELPRPQAENRDLLVRVEAVAVNPVDTKVRTALAGDGPPLVLGWDAAGVVEAIGAGVSRFRVGDPVCFAGDISRPGCNAEYVLVDERISGRKPGNLSFAEAAALPLTSLTAWEALFERLAIDPPGPAGIGGAGGGGGRDDGRGDGRGDGRSLLILGGAGGVGSIAIQLARLSGLEVIASASRPESQAWVRQLGADHVVDHGRPLPEQLAAIGHGQVDLIANFCDTDSYWAVMAELIRPLGSIVAIVGNRRPLDLNLLRSKSVRFAWEYMFSRSLYGTPDLERQGAILERVADLVEAGQLRSTLQRTLSPINAAGLRQAHAELESGRMVGKLVLAGWP
jgi:zinc-binding alcohol dehydrogenase family protein